MKSAKKVLAVALAIMMLAISALIPSSALFDDLLGEEDETLITIGYINESDYVQCIYVPGTTLVSTDGIATVTSDVPLAFDHQFAYWEDENGNVYHAGDEIVVTSSIKLTAVWEDKTDEDSYILRVIKTTIQAFIKIFAKFRDAFATIEQQQTTAPSTEEATA